MHHIACDAWSLEILRRELTAMAEAAAHGRSMALPGLPPSYHDFVRWQDGVIASPRGDQLWQFWQHALAAPRSRTGLPADRPRPAVQTYDGDSVSLLVPAELAEAIRVLARTRGVTPFVALLSMFMALVHRWSGQRDLMIGVPTAGRTQPQFAGVVGYFIEPVVIRVAIDADTSFETLLDRVQTASRAALSNNDFPFPLIVERLGVERDASRAPLFDITFNYLSHRQAPAAIELPQADGKFDLTLTMVDDERGLRAALGYNVNVFERSTVESIGASLIHLMQSALADPHTRVSGLPLNAGDDRPVLEGRRQPVDSRRLDQIVESWVRDTPDALAVVAQDG
jgi:non-ribosomal peptide synthetase component F